MSKKPYFSVVLPTRNRADLLPSAVRSVLNQTFEDFELIISDNFSTDNTSQVAKSFDDKRVKYFRSEKSLSIGDSLEFGLSHANGEFISFLSDDDAYSKVFLERFAKVITEEKAEIVTCNLLPYYSVDAFKYGKNLKNGTLVILPFNREIVSLDSKNAVNALYASAKLLEGSNIWNFVGFPQLVNATYHNSVIKKAQTRISKLFPVLCNDIYTAALFLNISKKYCYVDEPLYLHRNWEGSETTGYQNVFEKYPSEKIFDYVPLKKLYSSTNYVANLVLRAKSDWGEDYEDVRIDWNYYFNACYRQLMYFKSQGNDISEQLKELNEVSKGQ
ncbi:MAG TPA: glycosyltransferase family 2 protein, partial [Pyrinomonadaceae bacterium]|nr:glycosyltransferase family 2 protein [Pyrinomonadaceae bacterium]